MARVDTVPTAPLDPVFTAIAAQVAESGARMAESTVAQARERIAATAATCAPGPAEITAADERCSGVPVRRYLPVGEPGPGTVVHLHGGGWVTGDLDYADAVCRVLCRATGRTVLSVDYRLAPEHRHPAGLDDLRAVVGALAGDGPVLLSGDSSGANLAAVVAAERRGATDPVIDGQLWIYPVLGVDTARAAYRDCAEAFLGADQMTWFLGHYLPSGVDPATAGSDPTIAPGVSADLAGLPPTVVVTGGHDPLREEGAEYAARLAAAGVPVDHRHYPTLPHGFLQFTAVSETAAAALDDIADAAARLAAGPKEGTNDR